MVAPANLTADRWGHAHRYFFDACELFLVRLRFTGVMQAENWNIAVLGAWNRAILTPAWIQQVVLNLQPGSPVEVLVPLDGFAPFQIRDSGITVVPVPGQLLIQIAEATADQLRAAATAAKRAIEALPRTPLQACGINLRFTSPEPPQRLLDRWRCESERALADAEYAIQVRRRGESLEYEGGTINIISDIPTTGPCIVTLNFDRQSTVNTDLVAWLERDPATYIDVASRIMALLSE